MKNVYKLAFLLCFLFNPAWAAPVKHTDIVWVQAVNWDAACAQIPFKMNQAVDSTCKTFGGKVSGPFPVGPLTKGKDTNLKTKTVNYFTCSQKFEFFCNR